MLHSIIIPLYNESECIAECHKRVTTVMRGIGEPYEIIYVNDGSSDDTLALARGIADRDDCVRIIDFARNFGHQIAISAGIDRAAGNTVTVIDADLQDPPELIVDMINKWREGYEVVYAQRAAAEGISWFKRVTSKAYYRVLRTLCDTEIPVDVGDYRLMDKKVADTIRSMRERHRFMRGMVAWAGFKQTYVTFVRAARHGGETKYPLRKMLALAADGIVAFSDRPLKVSMYCGLLISAASLIMMLIMLCRLPFVNADSAYGLGILMLFACAVGGLILINLGFVGTYLSRVVDEVRARPLYIIRNTYGFQNDADAL